MTTSDSGSTLKLPPPLPPPSSTQNQITTTHSSQPRLHPKRRMLLIQSSLTRRHRHHHITPILKINSLAKTTQSASTSNHFTDLQFTGVPLTHLPSRTFHHSANPFYPIILLSHPFSKPGHFSSHVLYPSHIHHSSTSLEWPAL